MPDSNPDYNLDNLVIVESEGVKMYVTERFIVPYGTSVYENISEAVFLSLIHEDSFFVDVGAHYGYYSLRVAKKAIKGKVFSFEPVLESYEILKRNIELNSLQNCKAYNLALSEKKGKLSFNIANNSDCSGVMEHPLSKPRCTRIINVDTIDKVVKQKIDFIKIDVEGHESWVIRGMRRHLFDNQNLTLLVEFNPKCLYASKIDSNTFLEQLISLEKGLVLINDHTREWVVITKKNYKSWALYLSEQSRANIIAINPDQLDTVISLCRNHSKSTIRSILMKIGRSLFAHKY